MLQKQSLKVSEKMSFFYSLNQLFVLMLLVNFCVCQQSLQLPLTYSFDPNNEHKYSIDLSFDTSETSTPFQTDGIYLHGLQIKMDTVYDPYQDSVIIGLRDPSTFLYAIQALLDVQPHEIQFGKGQFLELLIKDNNFVESSDNFKNGDEYSMLVEYNFGESITVTGQKCYLIDGEEVFFDELFILQVLNSMDSRNQITFTQDSASQTITLNGKIENFPMISLLKHESKFQTSIEQTVLHYLPRGDKTHGINKIGYLSLTKFGKFSIDGDLIVFKRTAQLFQLYLFFFYFFVFTLIFLIVFRGNLTESMKFIKNVVAWVVFQKPEARIRVLRTQLE